MSALRLLAVSYLISASLFILGAALVAHPELGRGMRALAAMADEDVLRPALHLDEARPDGERAVRLTLALPTGRTHVTPPRQVRADDRMMEPEFSASARIAILPDLSPESAPVPPEPRLVRPRMPDAALPVFRIARGQLPFVIPEPPPWSQAPAAEAQTAAPGTRAEAVALHLRSTLTPEMLRNFDLFLYVSKAASGPLAQHMYVFARQKGELKLLHDWAVSTGRERSEITPRGRSTFTATPAGFYELDPDRMYPRYHSWSWDQDMPHAMFFNWERRGLQTGLAIHSATGGDIARLGNRASAGCVHLSPENAATLYRLIQDRYRGRIPRVATNAQTQTMSNRGDFVHGRDGALKMTDGYRVLVDIEDYGGATRLAGLY